MRAIVMLGMPMPSRRLHFVDLENVGKHAPIDEIATGVNEAIIFVGAKQKPPDEWLIPSAYNIQWVQIHNVSPDNLDFHLVLWVGFLHAKVHTSIQFVIWTGDQGMDDAFNTMQGRQISRIDPRPVGKPSKMKKITSVQHTPSSTSSGKQTIDMTGNRCKVLLSKTPAINRPRTKNGLINHISHWKKGIDFPQQPEQVFDWLVRKNILSIGDSEKISYNPDIRVC